MSEENQQTDQSDTNYRNNISKFTVDLSRGLQRRIRLAASQNGLSISEYLERILDGIVPEETSSIQQAGEPITHEAI